MGWHQAVPSRQKAQISIFILIFALFSLHAVATPKTVKKSPAQQEMCQHQFKIPSMGTLLEMQIVDICGREHDQFIKSAQNILNSWESEFSLYQPQSPISRLNKNGLLLNPSAIFIEGIQTSLEHFHRTFGQFNILVEPILKEIRQSFKSNQQPPEPSTLDKMNSLLQIANIKITPSDSKNMAGTDKTEQNNSEPKIEFLVPGAQITLDGIVKGVAVDKIAELANSEEIPGYLINFSGNMRWRGSPPQKKQWNLKAWNPVLQKAYAIDIPKEGAMASSGPEHNSFDEKFAWHHLISPKTLRPETYWMQTTVIGPSAADCDALSTATFVSDRKTLQLILKNYPGYRAYTVNNKGRRKHF